jgi:integral membrane protein
MNYSNFLSTLGRLRVVGFLEGLSFIILLGIAMPLKYLYELPEMVRYVGMAHGILFVMYVLLVAQVKIEYNWSYKKAFLAFLASLIPFGTFYADARLFRPDSGAKPTG